jgi:hypothetical protein
VPPPKLTAAQRDEIRCEYASGATRKSLAAKYGVVYKTILLITREVVSRYAGPLPPAKGGVRFVTPHITTCHLKYGDWIRAQYVDVREYATPHEAPLYARVIPATPGSHGGHRSGKWQATVTFETIEHGETAALSALLEALDAHRLPYERDAARAALLALASATSNTPWELRPIGVPGRKPPRKMGQFTRDGKRIAYYLDTMRRHADPECPCPDCTNLSQALKRKPPAPKTPA